MTTTATATRTEPVPGAVALAAEYLRSPAHGWSVGIPGAIAEFMYDADEAVSISTDSDRLCAVTARGAIAMTLPAHTRCVAIEEVAECTGGWNQSLAFGLPARDAAVPALDVITELGPDREAVTAAGRDELLFDLGVGSDAIRFCVRTADAALVQVLRAGVGRSVFAPDNPAGAALRTASPARVAVCALGRVEVFQSIAEPGGASPLGPHTHLLPGLLKKGSGIGAALPPGLVAPLRLYPEHPQYDKYGTPTPFMQSAHDAFQSLLQRFGAADYLVAKARFQHQLSQSDESAAAGPARRQPEWTAYTVARYQHQVAGGR